jgi:catechol 2,3-dioxygenase-like lactoylglutathione lyase family enzyme
MKNTLPRLDNIGIVVEDLKGAVAFFTELGMVLEGEMTVEGQWVDGIVGLKGVRNEIAMMRTPDGESKLELMKFLSPSAISTEANAPVNALGIRRIMFTVTGIDDVAARLRKLGADLIGEMVQYGDTYRLCYLRGPEGIIVALAEELGKSGKSEPRKSALMRMDNVLLVIEDIESAKAFFSELGLRLQGETIVEGPLVDNLIALKDVRATLALMRTPDGHGSIELDKFHSPTAVEAGPANAPVNIVGIRRIMFAVDSIDDVIARLCAIGGKLIGEVVQYEDIYRLCYLRGPEGIIIALAEQLGSKSAKDLFE